MVGGKKRLIDGAYRHAFHALAYGLAREGWGVKKGGKRGPDDAVGDGPVYGAATARGVLNGQEQDEAGTTGRGTTGPISGQDDEAVPGQAWQEQPTHHARTCRVEILQQQYMRVVVLAGTDTATEKHTKRGKLWCTLPDPDAR